MVHVLPLVSCLTSLLHSKMFTCAGELVGFKLKFKTSLICLLFFFFSFLSYPFGAFMFKSIFSTKMFLTFDTGILKR